MPNWKKLITSGSSAELSGLSLTGLSGQSSEATSLMINGSGVIGTRELGSRAFDSTSYIPTSHAANSHSSTHLYMGNGDGFIWNDTTNVMSVRKDGVDYVNIDSNNVSTYANKYSLPLGTASDRGGFKIGYTESGKNYPVELSSEKMYVNVPWTDTNTTYLTATASTLGLVKIGFTESGKNYPVELSSDKMFVNVPWSDTNTQRSDQSIVDTIEKNVNPVVSATVSNDTTTFTKQDGTTFALTTSDANDNTVTSIRKDNSGTYRTGNINLVGGDNVTIVEKASGEFVFSSTDTNTDTNTQRSDEEIRDVASAQWTNGTNTTVVKDDTNNTIKINSVNTTYAIGNGGLTQHNFTSTLKDKLDAIPFVQENDNIDIGTETIMSVYTSPWNAVFFDYVVIKSGNMRAGTVTAVNDGTNVEFTETSTADLGDTSDVKLFCDIDTDSMRFRATVTSNDWKVKVLPRMI
jgi:hypothetical protein